MSLQYLQDFTASDTLHLCNSMGVTKDYTNLWGGQTLLRELTDTIFNLEKKNIQDSISNEDVAMMNRLLDKISITHQTNMQIKKTIWEVIGTMPSNATLEICIINLLEKSLNLAAKIKEDSE